MFREMRRIGNMLPKDKTEDILKNNNTGVLAVLGDEDYPYTVPINFVYKDNKIYFHGAKDGHKSDAIKKNPKVSFCVIQEDLVVPEAFNTLFVSAIAFGKAKIIESKEQKREVMLAIIEKYSKDYIESGKKYIEEELDNCIAVVIDIEHLTGKAGD